MARLGLEENHCRLISQTVDAMFIRSSAFLVQSRDGRVVILCYRGTEPFNVLSLLTNVDVYPERLRFQVCSEGPFDVHGGFYRNVRATRYEVIQALERALSGDSVLAEEEKARSRRDKVAGDREGGDDQKEGAEQRRRAAAVTRKPMEALYITGHSSGGAMAALMTAMLLHEYEERSGRSAIFEKFRAVYTFGPTPAVCRQLRAFRHRSRPCGARRRPMASAERGNWTDVEHLAVRQGLPRLRRASADAHAVAALPFFDRRPSAESLRFQADSRCGAQRIR